MKNLPKNVKIAKLEEDNKIKHIFIVFNNDDCINNGDLYPIRRSKPSLDNPWTPTEYVSKRKVRLL